LSIGLYRNNQILEELAIHPNLWLGQLLVVACHTCFHARLRVMNQNWSLIPLVRP